MKITVNMLKDLEACQGSIDDFEATITSLIENIIALLEGEIEWLLDELDIPIVSVDFKMNGRTYDANIPCPCDICKEYWKEHPEEYHAGVVQLLTAIKAKLADRFSPF